MSRSLRSSREPVPRVTRFQMRSERTAVAPAVERVLRATRGAGLSEEQRDDLAVAMAEALSNAAVHGNRLDPAKRVSVSVEIGPGARVGVEVADMGGGFDLDGISDPTDPARRLIPGGRGVFLMRRLVDRVTYNAAGNSVRLEIEGRGAEGS